MSVLDDAIAASGAVRGQATPTPRNACADMQWRGFIDAVPVIVWKTSSDGISTFHNQRLLDYTGLSREEAIARGWSSMIHPHDRHRHADTWTKAVVTGEYFECEARLLRQDGEYRWFLARAEPRRDDLGNVIEWFGTHIDIHDRKMAEQALERNEVYLSETLRLSKTGTFGLNPSTGEFFYWSDEAYRIFDFDHRQKPLLGSVLNRFHSEDRSTVLRHLENASNFVNVDFRSRIVNASGEIKHIRITAHLVSHEFNDPHFLGTVSDISETVRRDELLNRLQADFAHASRVSLLGELSASIAHEIAQPMSAIAANGEAGQRWLNQDEPNLAELKALTNRIVANVHRANDIISRVRSMAAGFSPAREFICLDEAIREALMFLRHEIQARNVQVEHLPSDSHVLVLADKTQIQQVIVNLVLNAMQVMANAVNRSIVIHSAVLDGNRVQVTIDDTGTGIALEHLPRLFESFFSTRQGGMGIGLRLCRSIIEAHGGTIQAENRTPSPGARLRFSLPLSN